MGDGNPGAFHCEKFPVIYENDKIIYFKRNGSEILSSQYKSDVFEDTTDALERAVYPRFYAYSVNEEDLDKFYTMFDTAIKRRKAALIKNSYFRAKNVMMESARTYFQLTGEEVDPEDRDMFKEFFDSLKEKM